MTRIDNNEQYILLPKYEEGIEMKARVLTGKDLLENFKEDVLIDALDFGRIINYKGNDYFLDLKIEERK